MDAQPASAALTCFLVEDNAVIRENLVATLEEMVDVRVLGHAVDEGGALRIRAALRREAGRLRLEHRPHLVDAAEVVMTFSVGVFQPRGRFIGVLVPDLAAKGTELSSVLIALRSHLRQGLTGSKILLIR